MPVVTTLLLLTACTSFAPKLARDGGESSVESTVSVPEGFRDERHDFAAAASVAGGASPSATPGDDLDLPNRGISVFPDYAALMIIRIGHASVEVTALDVALADLQALALRTGGYVANTQFTGGKEQHRSASLEIRMPAERFDDAISGLRGIGTLETLQVSAEDVGEEYTDITARVANARRMEQRLIELLATRTGKLADVLTVEGELARVREQIERYEGRLRFLKQRTSMSRVTVSLHEPVPLVSQSAGPILAAFRQAWRNFVELVALAIGLSGVVIPVAAVLAGGWWSIRRRRRSEPQPA
jgi:hypothetical protein